MQHNDTNNTLMQRRGKRGICPLPCYGCCLVAFNCSVLFSSSLCSLRCWLFLAFIVSTN
jgi:hypothetical protein